MAERLLRSDQQRSDKERFQLHGLLRKDNLP
jgi:hypothetical protein